MLLNAPEIEKILTEYIHSRTFQRIPDLQVEMQAERLIVTGSTSIYFAKEAAVHSVFEAMEKLGLSNDVEFRVRVVDQFSGYTAH